VLAAKYVARAAKCVAKSDILAQILYPGVNPSSMGVTKTK